MIEEEKSEIEDICDKIMDITQNFDDDTNKIIQNNVKMEVNVEPSQEKLNIKNSKFLKILNKFQKMQQSTNNVSLKFSIGLNRLEEIEKLKSQCALIKRKLQELQFNCRESKFTNLFCEDNPSNDLLLANQSCKRLFQVVCNILREIEVIEQQITVTENLIFSNFDSKC